MPCYAVLIALQINNWNIERNNRELEANIYHDLILNLEKDSSEVRRILNLINSSLDAQRYVLTRDLGYIKMDKNYLIRYTDFVSSKLKMTVYGFSQFRPKYFYENFEGMKDECRNLYDLTFLVDGILQAMKQDVDQMLVLFKRELSKT